MHFVPSNASRLVQSADLVAYLHNRIHAGRDRDDRAIRANKELWARIEGKTLHRKCWYP
jgi:hypothetical protein